MQDNGLKKVVAALIDIAGTDDVFKVVEADEILEKLPAGTALDKQALSVIIRDLKGMGYLEVKYFTPDEYCLLVSRRAQELLVPETEQTRKEEGASSPATVSSAPAAKPAHRREKAPKHAFFGVLLAAFLGGIIGGAVVTIIAVLVQKLAL